jgi:hypothetical protein
MHDQAAALERQHWQGSRRQLEAASADPALRRQANRLLWEICQVLHDPDAAMTHLRAAIDEDPLFTRQPRDGPASPHPPMRSVLVLATPGDFQANLPLDRLFDDSTALHTLWLPDPEAVLRDPASAIPAGLPPIDCVFIAIAQDDRQTAALRAADALAAALGVPTINRGERIAALSRAGAAALLHDLPDTLVPSHHLVRRGDASPIAYPVIIRPHGSHAGQGLCRLDDAEALAACYAADQAPWFTVAPFVDYRSQDGAWRKYRVIFVGGMAYPLHLAIHDDWAVWYYNARMQGCEAKLAEERLFMADLGAAFPPRALAALRELSGRVGLDYFGLDCSVMPDGRLLVFEIETGMIVQDHPGLHIGRAVERLIDGRLARARGA